MPLVLLYPLLAGGAGFAAGSWSSSILGSLLKLGMVIATIYFFFFKGA